MSKKTPSDPTVPHDTRATVLKLRTKAGIILRHFLKRYPIVFLSGMLLCIIVSGILAFTLMRTDSGSTLSKYPKLPAVGSMAGITDALDSYSALQQVVAIQDTIAAIINKERLDDRDSIQLTDALKRFHQLQRSIYKPQSGR
ncbi:hypothetical protein [Sphingobacterium sp. CZ-UAM]|uniref:hypothetical protein n=1 Tax=Sphingobacterium sp. CZ-UAM TaxID=1933868 RepID=UPI001115A90F|nr:hypothetical protein [Sphingobacterium sp. CZ-UAM]